MLEITLDSVYSCPSVTDWPEMLELCAVATQSHAVLRPSVSGRNLDHQENAERLHQLRKAAQTLHAHVRAASLLSKYHSGKPLQWFLHLSRRGARQLLRDLFRRFTHSRPPLDEEGWLQVWDDISNVRKYALSAYVSQRFVARKYFRTILLAGHFPLARRYLAGTLCCVLWLAVWRDVIFMWKCRI
jgi:hypothetical protein